MQLKPYKFMCLPWIESFDKEDAAVMVQLNQLMLDGLPMVTAQQVGINKRIISTVKGTVYNPLAEASSTENEKRVVLDIALRLKYIIEVPLSYTVYGKSIKNTLVQLKFSKPDPGWAEVYYGIKRFDNFSIEALTLESKSSDPTTPLKIVGINELKELLRTGKI